MQIKYSRHVETRLALRKIEYDLPQEEFMKIQKKDLRILKLGIQLQL